MYTSLGSRSLSSKVFLVFIHVSLFPIKNNLGFNFTWSATFIFIKTGLRKGESEKEVKWETNLGTKRTKGEVVKDDDDTTDQHLGFSVIVKCRPCVYQIHIFGYSDLKDHA